MKDPDKYYTAMGRVLVDMTLASNPEKKRTLGMISKNDYALEQMARSYEERVKDSDDIVVKEQYEMVVMMARGRMMRE